jgi:hypothetical protein
MSGPEDYLFFPQYKNRSSAKRIAQRLFNALLKRCALKENQIFKYKHSLYSLRHTAICMRLTLSKGRCSVLVAQTEISDEEFVELLTGYAIEA